MWRLLSLLILGAAAVSAFAAQRSTANAVFTLAKLHPAQQRSTPPATAVDRVADGSFRICFDYGCHTERDVSVAGATLDTIRQQLASAQDATAERAVLAQAVGVLLAVAGRQTPVAADRAGNYLDQEVEGRMDCIDHSTSTTRMLRLIEARGWLRFHRVLEPARRSRLIMQHFGAVVEEGVPDRETVVLKSDVVVPDHVPAMLALCDCAEVVNDIRRPDDRAVAADASGAGNRYVVDSWFVDNGEAAIVLPLAEWLDGGGPNVQ